MAAPAFMSKAVISGRCSSANHPRKKANTTESVSAPNHCPKLGPNWCRFRRRCGRNKVKIVKNTSGHKPSGPAEIMSSKSPKSKIKTMEAIGLSRRGQRKIAMRGRNIKLTVRPITFTLSTDNSVKVRRRRAPFQVPPFGLDCAALRITITAPPVDLEGQAELGLGLILQRLKHHSQAHLPQIYQAQQLAHRDRPIPNRQFY